MRDGKLLSMDTLYERRVIKMNEDKEKEEVGEEKEERRKNVKKLSTNQPSLCKPMGWDEDGMVRSPGEPGP